VFGVVRVLNFAHGEVIMLGGYTAFWMFALLGMTPLWALIAVIPAFMILGWAIQRVFIDPLIPRRAAIEDTSMVLTYGLALVFASLARFAFTADYRSVSYLRGSFLVGDFVFSYAQVTASAAALALTVVFFAFLKYTRIGAAIRATAQNRDLAAACGIEPAHVYGLTLGLGVATAAAAGSIFSMLFAVYPEMGLDYTVRAFVIIILGGLGNLGGALLGAAILAVGETFAAFHISSQAGAMVPFLLIMIILFLRPVGLLGGSER
jgi:branched-chain amino acid transport system permease protein